MLYNYNRLFAANVGPRMGHRPQDYMVPFFPLVTIQDGFTKARDLGYVFDYLDNRSVPSYGLEPWKIAVIALCVLLFVGLLIFFFKRNSSY